MSDDNKKKEKKPMTLHKKLAIVEVCLVLLGIGIFFIILAATGGNVGAVIAGVIVAAIFSTPFIWPDVLGIWAFPVQVLSVVIIVATAVYCLAAPEITYRRYRYRIDDEKAELRKGIVFITHTMVPIERIHQVDVVRGPINRAFGLADVKVTTAGGAVTIEHLEEDVAEDIAGRLNQSVVRMLKERDRWETSR